MSDLDKPKVVDDDYVLKQYNDKIEYYWRISSNNKRLFRNYRTWTVILSALLTLMSAASAFEFTQNHAWLKYTFQLYTLVIAATLTVMLGLGQNSHSGSSWRDMVITASRLERERDRFLAISPETRSIEKELDIINGIILEDTRSFFHSVVDNSQDEVNLMIRPEEQG